MVYVKPTKQQTQVIFRDKTRDDLWFDFESGVGHVTVQHGILVLENPDERHLIPIDEVHRVITLLIDDKAE